MSPIDTIPNTPAAGVDPASVKTPPPLHSEWLESLAVATVVLEF